MPLNSQILFVTYRLDIPMQEAHRVYCLYAPQYLHAQPDCSPHSKTSAWLTAPQLRQVLSLQAHHHIVKPVITATADKTTHMVLS